MEHLFRLLKRCYSSYAHSLKQVEKGGTMDNPLDAEVRALLEVLAEGFYNAEGKCHSCGLVLETPVSEVLAKHADDCPTQRARVLLARNGTPAKLWHIQFVRRRRKHTHACTTREGVPIHCPETTTSAYKAIRCSISEEEARKMVASWMTHNNRGGMAAVVERSIHIVEVATVAY